MLPMSRFSRLHLITENHQESLSLMIVWLFARKSVTPLLLRSLSLKIKKFVALS